MKHPHILLPCIAWQGRRIEILALEAGRANDTMQLSNSPILDGSTLTEEDIKILNPDVNESQLLQIFPSGRFSGEQGTSLDLLMPPTPQERSETVKDLGSRNGHQPDHLTDEAIGI